MTTKLLKIAEQFELKGEIINISPLGCGLINKTYLLKTALPATPDYVLQQINHYVFGNVAGLQRNIEIVTDHLRNKLACRGEKDLDNCVLRLIPLKADRKTTFFFDSCNYWRMFHFIENSVTIDDVTEASAFDTGVAFGRFQADLADLSARLIETIPDFHNIEFRLCQLIKALDNPVENRYYASKDLISELLDDREKMSISQQLLRKKLLPKRFCHCDTKVNNILFDQSGKVKCVIDLDTVMPSFIFSDYGDFLRSAASTCSEDDPDFEKIEFRFDIFESFTRGYLSEVKDFLTPLEIEYLPHAVALFPYMQSVRFLTDYLDGDKYYHTDYPEHNLVRARNQYTLYKLVRRLEPKLMDIISGCL